MVIQAHIAQQRLLHVLPAAKAVGLEHIGDAPIEAFDHAVGLGRPGLGQTVLDVQGLTQLICRIPDDRRVSGPNQPDGLASPTLAQLWGDPNGEHQMDVCGEGRKVGLKEKRK